jgi:hypothetical protein
MALHNHVPETVIYVMVALLAGMVVGFAFGVGGHRQLFSTCVLSLSITLVLAVIIDLDRPRAGLIRVSQQPLLDLQQRLYSH